MITNHGFEPISFRAGCGHSLSSGTYCDRPRHDHIEGPSYERALERIRELDADVISLRSQRQILADSERSLSIKLSMARARVGNLENDLYYSEAERLKACEEAGNLQLRLDESLAREGALNTRLKNLDTLVREVSARVEKMTSALDR